MKIKNNLGVILLFCLATLFLCPQVFAHRVILFAWVEDGQVHVEGGFGSDKPAQNCEIKAFDTDQTLVFSGKTDKNGQLSFRVPDAHASDMDIELDAGPGHKGKWTIKADEFAAAAPPPKPEDSVQHQALEKGVDPLKILVGIGVIFGLAFGVGLLRKKAISHD